MSNEKLRVLVIPNTIFFPPYLEELREMEEACAIPRSWIHEIDAEVEYLDQRLKTNPSRWRRRIYSRFPMWFVQVLEAHRVGRNYDVVFLWSVANVALVLAALLKLTSRRIRLVALLTRISEPKKAMLLRLVHDKIAKIILPSVAQQEIATEKLGIPCEKIVGLPWTTDSNFWTSGSGEPEAMMICAAGGEMRDYQTLVDALAGLDIRCHVAGALNSSRQDWWKSDVIANDHHPEIESKVTFGTLSPLKLRELYAKSRLVVVPLKPTSSDNGITCINEAWSMGLPVIVSNVTGLRDAFVDGREGVWVPQGDVEALRTAIVTLWNDPIAAHRMGLAGRRHVELSRDHRVFVQGVNEVLKSAVSCM